MRFLHTSRPGCYDSTLSADSQRTLTILACALIPGDDAYPSAEQAHVPSFILERASADDAAQLERLILALDLASGADPSTALSELERTNGALFTWLRDWVYHGYYASPRVLAVMRDQGHAYHGAPQPLGYRMDAESPRQARSVGSYIPTDEVRSVHE